jgi:integrase
LHQRTITSHLKAFKKVFCGSLASLRATELDQYLATIPNAKTRLNHRITLCALFKFAQRKSFLPHGMTEAEKTERPHVEHNEPDILSPDDLKKLLSLCPDVRTLTFLLIGAFAGCRAAEIARLRWEDVREDCIVLGSAKTKTRRRRVAELPENLRAWLKPLRGESKDLVTWPEDRDHLLHRKIVRMREQAGVAWTKNCLRHTFVSSHLELHRDPPRTSKTSGHSLAVLERDYLKLLSREEAAAWFNIWPQDVPLALDLVDCKESLSNPRRGAKKYFKKILEKAALLSK